MPDDLKAILARVEEELGEDARAVLENELPMDEEGNLPEDVREAMAGELKAAQKMAEGVDYAGEQIALQAQQHEDLTEPRRVREVIVNAVETEKQMARRLGLIEEAPVPVEVAGSLDAEDESSSIRGAASRARASIWRTWDERDADYVDLADSE